MDITDILHEFLSKRRFTNGIHSLLKRNDARDRMHYTTHLAQTRLTDNN